MGLFELFSLTRGKSEDPGDVLIKKVKTPFHNSKYAKK